MADYWKSNPRFFCEFCKCWLADNKSSKEFHEQGKKHKENVKKRISDLSKKSVEKERKEKAEESYMEEMERKAKAAFAKDVCRDPALAAQFGLKVVGAQSLPKHIQPPGRNDISKTMTSQHPPAPLVPQSTNSKGRWHMTFTDEGYPYYWNDVTGETSWEKPACFEPKPMEPKCKDTMDEVELQEEGVESSNEGEDDQDETDVADDEGTLPVAEDYEQSQSVNIVASRAPVSGDNGAWQVTTSPEGYPYYWNSITGEVSWEEPKDMHSYLSQGAAVTSEATVTHTHPEVKSTPDPSTEPSPTIVQNAPSPIVGIPTTSMLQTSQAQRAQKERKTNKININLPTVVSEIPLPPPPSQACPDEDEEDAEEDAYKKVGQKRPHAAAYGKWNVVKQAEPLPVMDLQLPKVEHEEIVSIPLSREAKIKFREKKVDSLGAGLAEFKKRKIAQKNVKQRTDE